MKTVIYHSADYDGIFCHEIAKKFLGEKDVQYIGWNFGDPQISFPNPPGAVYVMDLPCDRTFIGYPNPAVNDDRIVWIDHHKSSIDSHPTSLPGYRIDGVAACRLAWQWFQQGHDSSNTGPTCAPLPTKQEFIDHQVVEPLAVRLAGEYDVAGPGAAREAVVFQYGLRSTEEAGDWNLLLDELASVQSDRLICDLMDRGEAVLNYQTKLDIKALDSAFMVEWEGVRFLTVNGRANSGTMTYTNIFRGKPVDAVMGFKFTGKEWVVSLYHAKHHTDLDLSQIAVKYGGGGHKGACGFTCAKLPFLL